MLMLFIDFWNVYDPHFVSKYFKVKSAWEYHKYKRSFLFVETYMTKLVKLDTKHWNICNGGENTFGCWEYDRFNNIPKNSVWCSAMSLDGLSPGSVCELLFHEEMYLSFTGQTGTIKIILRRLCLWHQLAHQQLNIMEVLQDRNH